MSIAEFPPLFNKVVVFVNMAVKMSSHRDVRTVADLHPACQLRRQPQRPGLPSTREDLATMTTTRCGTFILFLNFGLWPTHTFRFWVFLFLLRLNHNHCLLMVTDIFIISTSYKNTNYFNGWREKKSSVCKRLFLKVKRLLRRLE